MALVAQWTTASAFVLPVSKEPNVRNNARPESTALNANKIADALPMRTDATVRADDASARKVGLEEHAAADVKWDRGATIVTANATAMVQAASKMTANVSAMMVSPEIDAKTAALLENTVAAALRSVQLV